MIRKYLQKVRLPDVGCPATAGRLSSKRSYIWLLFVAAMVIQLAAWTAWFVIAAHHRVDDVPLVTSPRR